MTVKRINTEVEKKYLVEETHVLYHCSSSESKERIEEEEEMSSERKGKREKKEEGKNLDGCKKNGRERADRGGAIGLGQGDGVAKDSTETELTKIRLLRAIVQTRDPSSKVNHTILVPQPL